MKRFLAPSSILGVLLVAACGGATPLDDGGGTSASKAKPASSADATSRPPTNCRTWGPCDVPSSVPPTKTPPPSTTGPSSTDPSSPPPPDLPPKCQLGLPPAKRFASLTDEDIATLCDFLACARGGYGSRDLSCPDGVHHVVMPADKDACIMQETAAARAAGSACELTMGMMDGCYGAWGENLCVKPSSCSAIDAVAITCR